MKTPEEMAEEYTKDWWGNLPEAEGMRKSARENFLAGYKAAQQWISVKDRLPEEGMEVVIGWFQQTASNKLYWTTDVAILTNKAFGGWRNYPDATHWMELPAPPKEEK